MAFCCVVPLNISIDQSEYYFSFRIYFSIVNTEDSTAKTKIMLDRVYFDGSNGFSRVIQFRKFSQKDMTRYNDIGKINN